ncbi:unnamed protein product [Boreogadus saida]
MRDAIITTLALVNPAVATLTHDEWAAIEEACEVLQPYEEVTVEISGEGHQSAAISESMEVNGGECTEEILSFTGSMKEMSLTNMGNSQTAHDLTNTGSEYWTHTAVRHVALLMQGFTLSKHCEGSKRRELPLSPKRKRGFGLESGSPRLGVSRAADPDAPSVGAGLKP